MAVPHIEYQIPPSEAAKCRRQKAQANVNNGNAEATIAGFSHKGTSTGTNQRPRKEETAVRKDLSRFSGRKTPRKSRREFDARRARADPSVNLRKPAEVEKPPGSIVWVYFGDAFPLWPSQVLSQEQAPEKYAEAIDHFPGISEQCHNFIRYLGYKRKPSEVGLIPCSCTWSWDEVEETTAIGSLENDDNLLAFFRNAMEEGKHLFEQYASGNAGPNAIIGLNLSQQSRSLESRGELHVQDKSALRKRTRHSNTELATRARASSALEKVHGIQGGPEMDGDFAMDWWLAWKRKGNRTSRPKRKRTKPIASSAGDHSACDSTSKHSHHQATGQVTAKYFKEGADPEAIKVEADDKGTDEKPNGPLPTCSSNGTTAVETRRKKINFFFEPTTSTRVEDDEHEESRATPAISNSTSKNVQKVQIVEGTCHQCGRKKVECASCSNVLMKKNGDRRECGKRFCGKCLRINYSDIDLVEAEQACPYCRLCCNCKPCLRIRHDLTDPQTNEPRKRKCILDYKMGVLKPALKDICARQAESLGTLLEKTGRCKENIRFVDLKDDRICCDNCATSIWSSFVSCQCCNNDYCLVCVLEHFDEGIRIDGERHSLEDLHIQRVADESLAYKLALTDETNSACYAVQKRMGAIEGDGELHKQECPWCENVPSSQKRRASNYGRDDDFIWAPHVDDISREREDYEDKLNHFQWHWYRQRPVIVRGVKGKIEWHHHILVRAATEKGSSSARAKNASGTVEREEAVAVEGCWCQGSADQRLIFDMPTRHFFAGFENASKAPLPDFVPNGLEKSKLGPNNLLYKLKDYPAAGSFESKMPKHFWDFIEMLPFKEYTNPKTGPLNLANDFPQKGRPPDLGPKSYIAYGRKDERGLGDSVTRLHVDMADAVNVLVHSEDAFHGTKSGGGAQWEIFRREDRQALMDFLADNQCNLTYAQHGDKLVQCSLRHVLHDQQRGTVSSQVFMLTTADLNKLRQDTGVQPWSFEQHDNEAVFIPGGCAHQVRNKRSCVKVALDFVSPESSVESCVRIPEELRKMKKEDKLQGRYMLLNAANNALRELKSAWTEL